MEHIGVVGCGLMGSGIAEVTARAGAFVTVIEADEEALKRGQDRIEKSLSRAVGSNKMSEEDATLIRSHLTYSTDFSDLADAAGNSAVPTGGVATGFGGTAPHGPPSALPWLVLMAAGGVLAASAGLWLRRLPRLGT